MSKYVNECKCGKVIGRSSTTCRKCKEPRKLPSDREIVRMSKTKSTKEIARELGAHYSTINNILMKYK